MKAEYDFNNGPVTVRTPACFKMYMTTKNRGTLRIEVPRVGPIEKAFSGTNKALCGSLHDQVSEKLIQWKTKFSKATVTEKEAKEGLEKVKKAGVDVLAEEPTTTSSIKEFRGIDVGRLKQVRKSLKKDGVPDKIINAIKGCMSLDANSGRASVSKVTGRKLDLHSARIMSFRREEGFVVLLALSKTSLKIPAKWQWPCSKEEQPLAPSISQVGALKAYARIMAALHWKQIASRKDTLLLQVQSSP